MMSRKRAQKVHLLMKGHWKVTQYLKDEQVTLREANIAAHKFFGGRFVAGVQPARLPPLKVVSFAEP